MGSDGVSADLHADGDRLSAVWAEPAPLFVYGSLLFPEVMRTLIGRDPERTPAAIKGWSIVAIPGKLYPGLVPDDGLVAAGHLITDLAEHEWRVLDAFESDFYELRSVMTQDQTTAWVYALNDGGDGFSDPWDSTKFAQDSLEQYLHSCSRWRRSFKADV